MVIKEMFYVRLKRAEQQHLNVVIYAENYWHVVIIIARKHVMMDHVQIVHYYQRIVKHVPVERPQWIINNEHHVSIQYD
jgi:hypothetical protein